MTSANTYGLSKGDKVWVVSYKGLEEGIVTKVRSYKAHVKTDNGVWVFDPRPKSKMTDSGWITIPTDRFLAPFDSWSRGDWVAYRDYNDAKADCSRRSLEVQRFHLSKWINREASLEIVAEILEIYNREKSNENSKKAE